MTGKIFPEGQFSRDFKVIAGFLNWPTYFLPLQYDT